MLRISPLFKYECVWKIDTDIDRYEYKEKNLSEIVCFCHFIFELRGWDGTGDMTIRTGCSVMLARQAYYNQ